MSATEWSYKPAPDLERGVAERMRSFPRSPDMTLYALRTVMQVLVRGYLRVYHRLTITGREHLPLEDSFVLVCNHVSHLDTVSLQAALPLTWMHRTFPAAARDYFFSSVPRSVFSVIFVNGLPFDRQAKGAESLDVCRALLARRRHVLILFPEGTRSTTGEVGRFRSGIARLVAGTRVPVVPCYLAGGLRAFPKGSLFPRPTKLGLRIGAPMTFETVAPDDRAAVAGIADALREAVIHLVEPTPGDGAPRGGRR